MTKTELIDALSIKSGITRVKIEAVVNAVFDAMAEALIEDHRIEIRGFGSFVNRYHKAYQGCHPLTGVKIHIKAKRLPHFKTSQELKELVSGGPLLTSKGYD